MALKHIALNECLLLLYNEWFFSMLGNMFFFIIITVINDKIHDTNFISPETFGIQAFLFLFPYVYRPEPTYWMRYRRKTVAIVAK